MPLSAALKMRLPSIRSSGFPIRVVDNDPGILHVVDDVVADKVSPTSVFEFDAISLGGVWSVEVMQIIALDDPVKELGLGFSVG